MERADSDIRLLVRDQSRIQGRGWNGIEIVQGDVTVERDCERALEGIDIAYYLVHSMATGAARFSQVDREAAIQFSQVAKRMGVKRIIYLGGLGSDQDRLSEHLKSRHETGECLRSSGIAVTEFRAGVIIGSGSLSFEMLRYLTERVPVMICPRWVSTRAQPIAIRDILRYLIEALDLAGSGNEVFEIGGLDQLSYGEMMKIYAAKRGLRRWIINVPVLTPRLSSYWVNLVTPIPSSIARPLIDGVKNESIVTNSKARLVFQFQPLGYAEALDLALKRTFSDEVETHWASALSSLSPESSKSATLQSREGLLLEERMSRTTSSPESLYQVILRLGGREGWPYAHWLWEVRGWIDRLIGGVGLRRGRRSAHQLQVGDALDFWRVEAIETNRLLRLRAEMKVPGKAWLEFVIQSGEKEVVLIQRAIFEPKGLWGLIYWYSVYPIHGLMFQGMVDEIVRRAEKAHLESCSDKSMIKG